MLDLITALKLWNEVGSGPAKSQVLELTIEELSRLYRIEALAVEMAQAWTSDDAAKPAERHPNYVKILDLAGKL